VTRRRATWLIVITAAGAAAGVLWWRSTLPPAWWSPPNRADPRVAEVGERVEQSLISHAHEIRPADEPWSIRIHEDQVNAWLATRLPKWAAHRGHGDRDNLPGLVQLHFEPGRARIGAELPSSAGAGVLDVAISPTMADGRLRLSVNRVALGRVAVSGDPLAALVNHLKQSRLMESLDLGGEDVERITRAVLQGESIDPAFELQDGRIVRLLDLMVREGELVVQCRTEARR
jgi:hypothetical protein